MSAARPLCQPALVVPADCDVVARIRAGDEAACEALYLAHHEALWRFAYGYVRSSMVAEELVQEVFLALWRNRADWEPAGAVRPWLYAAVRNQALNHLRHERLAARVAERHAGGSPAGGSGAHAEPGSPCPGMAAPPPGADVQAEARDLDAAVGRAIAALPERRRAVMTLRWRHDLAPQEIAGVLGLTPEVVRVLLSRARRELATLLGRAQG